MGVQSKTEMILEGNADSVHEAYKQSTLDSKNWEKAVTDAVKKATEGFNLVERQLQQNHIATQKLVKENERLKEKIAESNKQQMTLGTAMNALYTGIAAVAGNQVVQAIQAAVNKQKEFHKEVANTGIEYDKVARKFQVQTLLSDKDFGETFKTKMLPLAEKYKVSPLDVMEMGRAAMTSGISMENLSGVLEESLIGAKSTNAADLPAAVRTYVGIQKAVGVDAGKITAEDIRTASQPAASAFATKEIEGDQQLALIKKVGGMVESSGLDVAGKRQMFNELLAAFVTTLDKTKMNEDEAATKLASLATRFRAPTDEVKKKLGPELFEATNLRGEGWMQTLANARSGMDDAVKSGRMTVAERDALIRDWVGQENANLFESQLQNIEYTGGILSSFKDDTQLRKGIPTATGGPAATKAAMEARAMAEQNDPIKVKNQLLIKAAEDQARAEGLAEWRIRYSVLGLDSGVAPLLEGFDAQGHDLEQKLQEPGFQAITPMGLDMGFYQRVLERYQQAAAPAQLPDRNIPAIGIPTVEQKKFPTAFQRDPLEDKKEQLEIRLKEVQLEKEKAELEALKSGGEIDKGERESIDKSFDARIKELTAALADNTLELKKQKEEKAKRPKNNLNL